MSAVAHIKWTEATEAPATLTAIAKAEMELANLFGFAGRMHQANIEHDPHSCVLCFEER